MPRRRRFFITLMALLPAMVLLVACAGNGGRWNPDDYTVKSGDTVYSIAWRYEIDPEELAAWNNLGSGKLIKPGQRLHTRKPADYRPQTQAAHNGQARALVYAPEQTQPVKPSSTSVARQGSISSSTKWIKAEKGDTLYSISRRSGVSVKRLAQLNQLKEPYVIRPGQTIFLKPLNRTDKTAATRKAPVAKAPAVKAPPTGSKTVAASSSSYQWPRSIRWQRPAQGKVVKKFSRRKTDAKGIDIAGKPGARINAAAAGKVVYSGNGLISYGNLIIIKHNRNYLSAYAYNRKLLVSEGDVVRAGQKIAEMGSKDQHKALLHFEIRKNGKPVDPLKYIPW